MSAARIREIRQRLGWSQQKAAKALMVVQSTWSKWESGLTFPSKARWKKILELERRAK